jgi:hypothetical protein
MIDSDAIDDKTLATLLAICELINPGKVDGVQQVVTAYQQALERVKEERKVKSLVPMYQNY